MNMRRIITFTFVWVAITALAIGLSGCERIASIVSDSETTMPDMMDGEIPIGVIVALTGDNTIYGIPMKNGFELASEEINANSAMNITLIIEDDQSSVSGAKIAVQSLVDQDVPALVGSAISTQFKAAFPIAQENGVVGFSSVSSAAGLSSLGDYLFRAALAADILVPEGVKATQAQLGYKTAAVIYDHTDVYSTSVKDEILKALEMNGVEVLIVETVETDDTDFTDQLTAIMKIEPDALFISTLLPAMTGIMEQARALGIPNSVPFICPELTLEGVQKIGAAAEGAISLIGWSSLSDIPGNQDFIQNYKAKYGVEPDAFAAQSYATLYILIAAIEKAGSTDSAAIRDALAQTMNFPTILGNFSFDPNGEAVYDPVTLIVKDGAFQVFE